MIIKTSDLKNICLGLDKINDRKWHFYINEQLILQENGSLPRIRQLAEEERKAFPELIDRAFIYEVRIIKSGAIAPLIHPTSNYQLSFDNGQTRYPLELARIAETNIQDFAWKIYLIS